MIINILIIAGSLLLFALLCYGALQLIKSRQDEKPKMIDEVPPDVLNNLKAAAGKSVMPEFVIAPEAVAGMSKAFAGLGAAMKAAIPAIADFGNSVERVLDSKTWAAGKPYIDWHDLWVGVYWKLSVNDDIDSDILDIYVCLIPCVVIHIVRVRCYRLIPKIDTRIDPVCYACGLPHSEHVAPFLNYPLDTGTEIKSYCAGKFLL